MDDMKQEMKNGCAIFYPQGIIDLFSTEELKNELLDTIRANHYANVIINFQDVQYVDSSGIAVFVKLYKDIRDATSLRLCGMNEIVYDVFKATNLHKLLTIDQNEADSLAAISA